MSLEIAISSGRNQRKITRLFSYNMNPQGTFRIHGFALWRSSRNTRRIIDEVHGSTLLAGLTTINAGRLSLSNGQSQGPCPKCGAHNQAAARFCASCGLSFQTMSTVPSTSPSSIGQTRTAPANPFSQFMSSYYATEPAKAVERTKNGLLVISISFFVSWIPVLGIFAYAFEVVGAILVILGRKSFGPTHARNVIWSIMISILAFVSAAIVGVAIVVSTLSNPQYNPSAGPPSPSSDFALFSTGVIIATAIFGIALVLLTYAFQLKSGKILLWSGYVSAVAASIVSELLLRNVQYLNMLPQLAPGILFGYAYYLARSRIVHGEIPQPTVLA